jgi:tripartite-type tricarboxylate transporter receptor subunit TctC
MTKTWLIASALIAVMAVPLGGVAAADWPNRPIHFIVPFPAGGSTDVAARVVGDYLSRTLGQSVVVENRSGANGNIGMEYVAKAEPDGYTILVATDAVSSNQYVYKLNFDPARDLTPVIELSHQPIALAAHPSLGVSTLAELTAKAKQQPGMRYLDRQSCKRPATPTLILPLSGGGNSKPLAPSSIRSSACAARASSP